MKYFLIIAMFCFAGCRVPYPSIGAGAKPWKQKCVTKHMCDSNANCQIVKTCYYK